MTSDFIPSPSRGRKPMLTDPLSEMTRRLERGRSRLGVGAHTGA